MKGCARTEEVSSYHLEELRSRTILFRIFFISYCCRYNFHVVQYILSLKIQYGVFVKISVVRFLNIKYIKYICTQNTELNLHLDSGTLCTQNTEYNKHLY